MYCAIITYNIIYIYACMWITGKGSVYCHISLTVFQLLLISYISSWEETGYMSVCNAFPHTHIYSCGAPTLPSRVLVRLSNQMNTVLIFSGVLLKESVKCL